MKSKFNIVIDDVVFEFMTMNVQRIQLFQVYTDVNGVKKRFHMQLAEDGTLKFALPEECPAHLLALEQTLSDHVFSVLAEPVN